MAPSRRLPRAVLLAVTTALASSFARPAVADPTSAAGAGPEGVFGQGRQGEAGAADATGAFTFGIPLAVPKGRGTVQPRLGVTYNSAVRTGNAGFGWNLQIPSIERRPLSGQPVFDGPADVQFRERFVYGGRPLVLVCQKDSNEHPCGGVAPEIENEAVWPGAQGGNYFYFRAQVEDGTPARFLLSGDRRTWRVQLKGGAQMTFGGSDESLESVPNAPSHYVRWHLTSEIDGRNPNPAYADRVEYRWAKLGARGHAYPTDVYWTPPVTGASSDANWAYHAELSWMANANAVTSYGSPLKSGPDQLLKAIGISAMPFAAVSARLVQRIYRFSYLESRTSGDDDANASPLFHEAFLRRVVEEGRCGRTESGGHIPFYQDCQTLPPLDFAYEGKNLAAGAVDVSRVLNGTFAEDKTAFYNMSGVSIVDFDRDGLPDIVQSWPGFGTCAFLNDEGDWVPGPSPTIKEGDIIKLQCANWSSVPPPNTYARPVVGFLNEGALSSVSPLRLRHQCMDAGDPAWAASSPLGLTADNALPGFLTSVGAITLLGPFGQSPVAWQNADFGPMFAAPHGQPTDPQGKCLLPMAPPAPMDPDFAPTWTWRRPLEDWAKPTLLGPGAWLADVDGDGLVDGLSARPTVSGDLAEASVRYTRRYARGERDPGHAPAQVPFDLVDSQVVSVAPRDHARKGTTFFYADMNGDGFVDLVTSNPDEGGGSLRIRPGDGRGRFACDIAHQPWPCSSGDLTAYYTAELPFPTQAVPFTDQSGLHDVTGDGLADIVKLVESVAVPGAMELWVWVNRDGHTFSCVGGTPAGGCNTGYFLDTVHPNAPFDLGTADERKLTFADMNADGIDDVVLVTKTGVHVASLMKTSEPGARAHAPRPGLLTRIDNGRGATTRLRYQTIQELDLSARASTSPWKHHSRLPGTVLTEMRTEDTVVDSSWNTLPQPFGVERATTYTYRDPAYDRWERRVLGFRTIREAHEGESAVTETTYWFSACQNDSIRSLYGDNPEDRCRDGDDDDLENGSRPARRPEIGRPNRIERFIPGVAGRSDATFLWAKELTWDARTFSSSTGGVTRSWWRPRVKLEKTVHFRTDSVVTPGSLIQPPFMGEDPVETLPSQVGARTVLRRATYDGEGSLLVDEDWEDIAGAEKHPAVTTYSMEDLGLEQETFVLPGLPCDANYVCRPTHVTLWTKDRAGYTQYRKRRATEHVYGAGSWAGPTEIRAGIGDTGSPLVRQHAGGGATAPGRLADADGAVVVMRPVATMTYDLVGNVVQLTGDPAPLDGDPAGNVETSYDPLYGQFPETVRRFPRAFGYASLNDTFVYDRATGAPVVHFAPNGAMSSIELDDFGRTLAVFAPDPDAIYATVPATTLTYRLASPLSSVETHTVLDGVSDVANVTILNALGEPVMSFDGGGASWVARASETDRAGRVIASRAPKAFNGDPLTVAASAVAVFTSSDRGAEVTYDGFGRPTRVDERTANASLVALSETIYGVFDRKLRDAEQLRAGSPRQGGFVEVKVDHRGHVLERTHSRATGYKTTDRFERLVTGETTKLEREDDGVVTYRRTAEYDTLGRLRANTEPNVGTWRYLYSRDGRLLGTSDARGCGVDYYYDGLGRVVGEDYSPCTTKQPEYTAPDLATGEGLEVQNIYDDYESGQVAPDATFGDHGLFAVGSLVAVRDRGSYTRFNTDSRGRMRKTSRLLATPPRTPAEPTTYASTWYASRVDHDLGGRMVRRTSGATAPELLVNGTSEELWQYTLLSQPAFVTSSYGDILRGTTYAADGLPEEISYGDIAGTKTELAYDTRRRLTRLKTSRAAVGFWSGPAVPGYSVPPAETTRTLLHDVQISSYDAVGNPGVIQDLSATNGTIGHAAKQRSFAYDSDDRLASVAYSYAVGGGPSTTDTIWRHPFQAENAAGDRSFVPLRSAPNRVTSQSFAYDGLGNITSSTDNASMNWDRSLGTVTRGTGSLDPEDAGRNQLRAANGISAAYDEAGNLVELKVERQGTCTSGGVSRCRQWYAYDWDEAGRLLRARRWDYTTSLPSLPPPTSASERPVPTDTPVRDLKYAYSLGQRVEVWKKSNGVTRVTADVLPTLRLDDAAVDGTGNDYVVGATEQRPRLAGIAEVHWDPSLPTRTSSGVHMFLAMTDELGSSTVMIEHATSELAERVTYQAYGATEQDTRPARWGAHREPIRFTGKEDDLEVGLTYFGARYYVPNLAQWASADPLTIHAMGADLNPYAYVAGRVSTHVDPWGLDATPDPSDPTIDTVEVRAPPRVPRDVQYNDRAAMTLEQMARQALAWNVTAQRNANAFMVGLAHSVPLFVVPGAPMLGSALETVGVGTAPDVKPAKIVGQIAGFGLTIAVGSELNALARTASLRQLPRGGGTFLSRSSGPAFDAAKLARIQANLEAEGVGFVTGAEGDAMLRSLGGEAAYLAMEGGRPGVIVLGSNPSRAAVVEELLHLGQHRATGWSSAFGSQVVQFEIQAQQRLLGIGSRLGWSQSEMNGIESALRAWGGR